MFEIKLEYKEYNVGIDKFWAWVKQQTQLCCGISANSSIQIHFTEKPSDEIIATIQEKWNTLIETDFPYISQTQVKEAIEAIKQSLLTKDMATWTALDRKVFMNMEVTNTELGL